MSARPRRWPARTVCRACRISPPKAKRVIYLFQSGAPSQIDLFDHKPAIRDRRGIELPDSVRMGQRITTMTSGQKSFPVAPSIFKFAQHGQSRRLAQRAAAAHGRRSPTTSASSGRCRPRRSTTTRRSRSSRPARSSPGRPSMGAWVAYGLGSMNQDLPAFVVLLSRGRTDQPLYDRLWGSGLPADALPGREAPRRQGAGALPRQSRPAARRRCGGRCSTTSAS